MEHNFNTIDLEVKETRKVSGVFKFVALILLLIFIVFPIYELVPQANWFPPIYRSLGCGF